MAIDPQDIGGTVNRIAEEAKNKVREAGAAVKCRTEEALGTVGQQMSNLAGSVQAGGRYLQEHDLRELGGDLTSLVRRYPLVALGACFGLGCLLGMTWKRR